MENNLPSISELQDMLRYDPETGLIYWIQSTHGRRLYQPAGTKCKDGYLGICLNGPRIRSHRIAWALYHGEWPENQIDHINGDKSDNRIVNLRKATNSQNGKNLPIKSNNKSGYPGVFFRSNKWRVQIKVDHKSISLGSYSDFDEAVKVKKEAEAKYFGKWRRQK
jgi:hypothetical protein